MILQKKKKKETELFAFTKLILYFVHRVLCKWGSAGIYFVPRRLLFQGKKYVTTPKYELKEKVDVKFSFLFYLKIERNTSVHSENYSLNRNLNLLDAIF